MHSNDLFISIGSIIIDDIIMPDGLSKMNILGGGTSHTCMGMRLWSKQVGIVSQIGTDFPEIHEKRMSNLFLTQGLVTREIETTRAWQLLEKDGTRNELFRTDFDEMISMAPGIADFPDAFNAVKGVHLHSAIDKIPEWVTFLKSLENAPIILWEPWDPFCAPENLDQFMKIASLVDVVSPNAKEAAHLTGLIKPEHSAAFLLESGVDHVVIRNGSKGSLIASNSGSLFSINAVPPVEIIDTTGAGNAYCGGFICGLASGSLETAAEYGSVAASFALTQFGAFYELPEDLDAELEKRLSTLSIKKLNPRRPIFDLMAASWDNMPLPQNFKFKAQQIARAGEIKSGAIVLDIGTGTGNLNEGLLENNPKAVYSLDLSHAMLSKAKDKANTQHSESIELINGDAVNLPMSENSVHTIICHGVFPHLTEPEKVLTEFERVIKPNGYLVITHSIGRQKVNHIHTNAKSRTLHQDILPTGDNLAKILDSSNWKSVEIIDETDFYLVKAQLQVDS